MLGWVSRMEVFIFFCFAVFITSSLLRVGLLMKNIAIFSFALGTDEWPEIFLKAEIIASLSLVNSTELASAKNSLFLETASLIRG